MRLSKAIHTIIIVLIFLQSCNHFQRNNLVNQGYPYPSSYKGEDSNDFFYPLRSKFNKGDSLAYSLQYLFYHAFNEPNLSLKYVGTPTYRISFYEAFGRKSIISLSGRKLTVKDSESGSPHPDFDTSRLEGIEKLHYNLLLRSYPLDDTSKRNRRRRHYLDSMIAVYPMLVDANYYKQLIEKVIVKSKTPFVYSTASVVITDKQYDQFVNLLNHSGYWNLPYHIKCDDPPLDGIGFILEANTEDCYNLDGASSCGDSNSSTKLKIACQQLIDYTNFGKQNPDHSKRIIVTD